MEFVLDGWMYIHLNLFCSIILLLFAGYVAFKLSTQNLVVAILFLFVGPLNSSLKSVFYGLRFDFTLALQFIFIMTLYLKSKLLLKKGSKLVTLFIIGIFVSNIYKIYTLLLCFNGTEFLKYISLGFLGSLNTVLFLFYLNRIKVPVIDVFFKLSYFFVIYGALIICEGMFNFFTGISNVYAENISHNSQLYTFLGQGPDGISRLIIMGFLSFIFLKENSRLTISNYYYFLYFFLGCMVIFLTLSRTAYLMVLLIVIAFVYRSKLRMLIIILLIPILLIIVNFLFSNSFIQENKSTDINSLDTLIYRLDLFYSAYEVFASNINLMFTGVGYRMYYPFIQSLGGVSKGGIFYENHSFENKLIEIIIETGILGLIFILFFTLFVIRITVKNIKSKDSRNVLPSLILLLIYVGAFVVNMDWIVLYIYYYLYLKFTKEIKHEQKGIIFTK